MENNNYEFDALEVIQMSKEEAISLLGPENAARVTEGLKDGTLTYTELNAICKNSFLSIDQAKLVRNAIFNQLSSTEGFNLFESNKEKQEMYAKMLKLQERAQNGEFTKKDLKELCDIVFGENTELSVSIQKVFIATGKVKPDNPDQQISQNVPQNNFQNNPENDFQHDFYER